MHTIDTPVEFRVSGSELSTLQNLLINGLCIQAFRAAEKFAPLKDWRGTDARVFAGRLVYHLGAPRLSAWHFTHAWRADPTHPEATYYYARTVLERRGPLQALRFLQRVGGLKNAPANVLSDWQALHSCILCQFRDFEAAEHWLKRAEETCPDLPWTHVERAYLYEREDRYEDALQTLHKALEIRPGYRPAIQSKAHILQLLERDDEAVELLHEAAYRLESGPVAAQLAALQIELKRFDEGWTNLDRYAELTPLLEKGLAGWLNARRADVAYYQGRYVEAAEFARKVEDPQFFTPIAERLSQTPVEGKRVLLDVEFVRQHYQTCVPSTLAAIARYWGKDVDHLGVADTICYDGTPDHLERSWAENNGWFVKEFAVTWDSAVALLDRGIPFTLTTIDTGNAHMQAVIGYDTLRKTLLIRDPFLRNWTEFVAETMLKYYQATGPRGMALVPVEKADLLRDLELPEQNLYDRVHRLQRALFVHDRNGADEELKKLQETDGKARMTLFARRILAGYDGNTTEMLAALEEMLELFPQDPLLELSKVGCLRELARREDFLELLKNICERKNSDPIFGRQYARELMADARENARTQRLLRRTLRFRPCDQVALMSLGTLHWDKNEKEEAIGLYRLAACLDDKDERLARTYFIAARWLKREQETLAFLTRRFERFGKKSSQPACTLYWALSEFERTGDGLTVLEKALQLRPDDGPLLLYVAEVWSNVGNMQRAEELLALAKGKSAGAGWLRSRARLHELQNHREEALRVWQEIAASEPLALDAHRAVAQLLAEQHGMHAGQEYLQSICARFPHHFGLHQAWLGWLRQDGGDSAEPVIRHMLEVHPDDAWTRRELVLCLADQGRFDEAFAEMETAHDQEPWNATSFAVRGQLCERAGRIDEAKDAYMETIRRSVDNDFAIGRLMQMSDTLAERRESLTLIKNELVRQVTFGDGLLAFQFHARGSLPPEDLLTLLREGWTARQDLWHSWSALILQLGEMRQLDEAASIAERAVDRFPLLPRLWVDLAFIRKQQGKTGEEIDALRQCLKINPNWSVALRRLSEALDRNGQLEESRDALERCVTIAPLEAVNHGCLAELQWRLEEKEAALNRVQHALMLDPGYEWAWDALRDWSHHLKRPEQALRFVRTLTERRPDEARSWLMLARFLPSDADIEERLNAFERAIELNPRCVDAYDLKVAHLVKAGRFREAREILRAPVWEGNRPLVLSGREAWIEAEAGRTDKAIELMQATLREDPQYYWGWERLAEWSRTTHQTDIYLEAGNNLVRLAPYNCVSFGYRGEARNFKQDRAGAKEDFLKAFNLDNGYSFAGIILFDLQWEDKEYEAAAKTIEGLKKHNPDEYVLAREVQVASQLADRTRASTLLKSLCEVASGAAWPLDTACRVMKEAGWSADVAQVLDSSLALPNAVPHAVKLWVSYSVESGKTDLTGKFDDLLQRPELGRCALLAYCDHLKRSKQKKQLREFTEKYSEELHKETQAWGSAGGNLGAVDEQVAQVKFMSDWEQRSDAQPWMLLNLAFGFRNLGSSAEANRVHRKALELNSDYTTDYHRVWLAFEEALGGEFGKAKETIAEVERDDCDPPHIFIHGLTTAMIQVQATPASERSKLFRSIRKELADLVPEASPWDEDRAVLLQSYRRALRRLSDDFGGMKSRLWRWWRTFRPLLPKREGET